MVLARSQPFLRGWEKEIFVQRGIKQISKAAVPRPPMAVPKWRTRGCIILPPVADDIVTPLLVPTDTDSLLCTNTNFTLVQAFPRYQDWKEAVFGKEIFRFLVV